MPILRRASSLALVAILIAACTGNATPSPAAGAFTGGAAPISTFPPFIGPPAPSATLPPLPLTGGGTPAPGAATYLLTIASSPTNGQYLTGTGGVTLYTFAKDVPGSGKSACIGACGSTWKAFTTGPRTSRVQPPAAAPGITGAVTFFSLPDGTRQVAYNGWPLYTYTGDTAPGEARGHAFDSNWNIVWTGVPPG